MRHNLSALRLPLTCLSVFALAIAGSQVHAQNLLYTLSGVTFEDNSIATGSFVYNPTTNGFGAFDLTTTDGTTGLTGFHYTSTMATAKNFSIPGFYRFDSSVNSLILFTSSPATNAGSFALALGSSSSGVINNSGEFTPTPRQITGGSLIVAAASPVPEPGSIALLAGMGLSGAGFLARRRKQVRKAA